MQWCSQGCGKGHFLTGNNHFYIPRKNLASRRISDNLMSWIWILVCERNGRVNHWKLTLITTWWECGWLEFSAIQDRQKLQSCCANKSAIMAICDSLLFYRYWGIVTVIDKLGLLRWKMQVIFNCYCLIIVLEFHLWKDSCLGLAFIDLCVP